MSTRPLEGLGDGWNEKAGVVSRAFNDWFMVDRDQRAFLALGLEFSSTAFDRIWKQAGEEPGDPDGPDQLEIYERRARGLFPQDYEWMHLSGVLRDAVTNFEVYLEKAKEEVEGGLGPRRIAERAPKWWESRAFFSSLGVEIDTADVAEVRNVRHVLAHRRGELRTEEMRRKYAPDSEFPWTVNVELTEAVVLGHLDVLGAAVRRIDPVVWGAVSAPRTGHGENG